MIEVVTVLFKHGYHRAGVGRHLEGGSLVHERDRQGGRGSVLQTNCKKGDIVLAIQLLEDQQDKLGWALMLCRKSCTEC